ncbi:hypothetical protein V5P93_002870 [Actinokineospora auranticolor]|uniref:Uncharacterized protein n=1 Tax=Actinokineospora auranticolor TaxID=155976 RepID=A0A2S6H0I5_9PSEU|nr:hypothetical protein [Actinokineospora auranticolor]PPK71012.1 hypothetical protein CLV40_101198 [Actinokineospora auranticolor]
MSEPVLVVVSADAASRLPEVVADLTAAGLRVEHVLAEIGTITGSAPTGAIRTLRAVSGVDKVEPACGDFGIPPPDSEVQ